ncbi:MAG TPA: type II toxin-antitoxin system MqsA family antitoxin [Candidatus Competibacter sp.]|nr:type II toxin-antitoxin system MqsA family antitoxin [Candidatus Competibacter sp.]HUM93561.1 type II toxin-antitoxin system MqsA family antitoxin [Candidatus Competibacter sp.]
MNCVICKTGALKPQTVSVTVDRQGALLVVQGVPALVCDNCGERYFEDAVSARLLELTEQALQPGVSLDIRQYQRQAA